MGYKLADVYVQVCMHNHMYTQQHVYPSYAAHTSKATGQAVAAEERAAYDAQIEVNVCEILWFSLCNTVCCHHVLHRRELKIVGLHATLTWIAFAPSC